VRGEICGGWEKERKELYRAHGKNEEGRREG
jgi:hypothetical protein